MSVDLGPPVFGYDIEIVVFDGADRLEARRSRTMLLPDGRPGALWRGLVYPLSDSNEIDVAGEAFPPAACSGGTASQLNSASFASIQGADESYLLLSGPVAIREAAVASLRAAGVSVIRPGRYLGDPVDGFAADWFVRFEKPDGDEPIDELLARVLGRQRARQETPSETASETRLRLLQDELSRAREREAALRSELTRAKATAARDEATATDTGALRDEIADEQRLRYEAESGRVAAEAALEVAQVELEAARVRTALLRPASPKARMHDEISDVLEILLPNLNLLRDSLTVAASEYAGRKALYRSLAELAVGEGRLPANWKAVQGAAGWWERHVSDGQGNTGRLYAHFLRDDRRWDVLISDKAEQSRDMAWLRRHTPG
jgi:hypothetical protein